MNKAVNALLVVFVYLVIVVGVFWLCLYNMTDPKGVLLKLLMDKIFN